MSDKNTKPAKAIFGDMPTLADQVKTDSYSVMAMFSGLDAVSTYVTGKGPGAWYTDYQASGVDRAKFYGTASYEEAAQLAEHGWKAGAKDAARFLDKIEANAPARTRFNRFDVAGAVPDVARAISGNPMNMRRAKPVQRTKVITLLSDLSSSGAVKSTDLQRRAVCVAAIVDRIENAGYRCELSTLISTQCGATRALIGVRLKAPDQPVDLGALAYGLGHPAMLRRHAFGVMGVTKEMEGLGYGLGQPMAFYADAPETYVIPALKMYQTYFTNDQVAELTGLPYLIHGLIEQGCEALQLDDPAEATSPAY